MSLARIPFSAADEQVIGTLNGWMLFLAIIHFIAAVFVLGCGCFGLVGAVGQLGANPVGGALFTLQMFTLPVLGAVMGVEGLLALQARSALEKVVSSDSSDQQFLSDAFHRLKLFFMLELVWFGVSVLSSFFGIVLGIVAPELAGGFGAGDTGWNVGGDL
jgi:hypothetical protein